MGAYLCSIPSDSRLFTACSSSLKRARTRVGDTPLRELRGCLCFSFAAYLAAASSLRVAFTHTLHFTAIALPTVILVLLRSDRSDLWFLSYSLYCESHLLRLTLNPTQEHNKHFHKNPFTRNHNKGGKHDYDLRFASLRIMMILES